MSMSVLVLVVVVVHLGAVGVFAHGFLLFVVVEQAWVDVGAVIEAECRLIEDQAKVHHAVCEPRATRDI
jgi:hypothetical protein